MIGKNFCGSDAVWISAAKNAKNAEKEEKSLFRILPSPIFASFAFFAAKMDLERPRPLPTGGATFQSRPGGWNAGGTREEVIYKNIPNPASRTRTAWRGLEPALKTMKTASRTWKAGGKRMDSRGAGVPPARRQGSGRQAKRPMFSVISYPPLCLEAAPPKSPRCPFRSFRATSGGAASCRAMADGGRKNSPPSPPRDGREEKEKQMELGGTDAPSVRLPQAPLSARLGGAAFQPRPDRGPSTKTVFSFTSWLQKELQHARMNERTKGETSPWRQRTR